MNSRIHYSTIMITLHRISNMNQSLCRGTTTLIGNWDVIRIKLTKKPGEPLGLSPKQADLYKSILRSLGKMFEMMHIVQKVEVDTSCIVVVLKKGEFMKSPLEVTYGANTAIDAIKDKIQSRQEALKASSSELNTLKKRIAEVEKHIVWTETDIKTLNKALEIMIL